MGNIISDPMIDGDKSTKGPNFWTNEKPTVRKGLQSPNYSQTKEELLILRNNHEYARPQTGL